MICSECETKFEGDTCPECECMRRFAELENRELRLADELAERLSYLEMAKQTVKNYEKAVAEIRKEIKENDTALRDFKWWTATD